jgi:hypothetical protein
MSQGASRKLLELRGGWTYFLNDTSGYVMVASSGARFLKTFCAIGDILEKITF